MKKRKTIIVDCDVGSLNLLAEILELEGYQVTRTRRMPEGINFLTRGQYDLIVTEAFAQADQFEYDPSFLDEYRRVAPDTPILLCTTYPSVDYLTAGECRATALVRKPFELDDLLKTVRETVGQSPGESPSE